MRCKQCGKIITSGTICDDCNKNLNKSEIDNNILMTIGSKFNPKYHILLNWEWLLFCLLVVIISIMNNNFLTALCCILLIFGIFGVSLFISKRIAMGTKVTFYETKVVYRFNAFGIHKKKVLKYTEIKDIVLNRRKMQKKFGLGNLNIINKKSKIVFSGIIIQDVANAEDTFKKLTNLIGTKIG